MVAQPHAREGVDHADRIQMQNRLFGELSRMFAQEVPLYDSSLEVNHHCNRAVCDLLERMYDGFHVTDAQLEKTSGERHGAIRIGRADEYRWIRRFFACFGMHPHNFYDMTAVGAKSQPVIATAFRSLVHPGHRVFASLLQPSYFDAETQRRIEAVLRTRRVFSDEAMRLIEKAEERGGLAWDDADRLIGEGVERIFAWTGGARDHGLYEHLCESGYKIAADIVCFRAHHLNHLTPNTFCIDLYTSAMKLSMGGIDGAGFRHRATIALERLADQADVHFLRLCFKHLTRTEAESFVAREIGADAIEAHVATLERALDPVHERVRSLDHNGFKDATEGPSWDTPVLLRQDAYKALTERVVFENEGGELVEAEHTARFGEIEQRFYATTPRGRALYDECLAAAEAWKAEHDDLAARDPDAYDAGYAEHFAPFPKRLPELLEQGLVYGRYEPTEKGVGAKGRIATPDIRALIDAGYAAVEGLRYEDFLPVSAAGIFASNLNEYGTASTADEKPTFTKAFLEEILGYPIVEAENVYRGLDAASRLSTLGELGVLDALDPDERRRLEHDAAELPDDTATDFPTRSVLAAKA